MKTKPISNETMLSSREVSRLNRLKADSLAGRSRPARVRTIVKDEDGTITITEGDPEAFRKQRARAFEAKNRVSKLRHQMGQSQAEFADLLGIPLRTLQGWERNATRPSGAAETLLDIVEHHPETLESVRKIRNK
jgi:DNA-binding transcriptional regulator YiaG